MIKGEKHWLKNFKEMKGIMKGIGYQNRRDRQEMDN